MYKQVLQDINPTAPNFVLALADLNAVSTKFPTSTVPNDRAYYYVIVYNGLARPEKVLESAAPLITAGVAKSFPDQEQVLQVLVDSSASLPKIATPTAQQVTLGQKAARQLLEFLPDYFAARRKPAGVTDAAWSLARTRLEAIAQQALGKPAVARKTVN